MHKLCLCCTPCRALSACSCRYRAVINGTFTSDSRHFAWHVCSARVTPFRCRCTLAYCTRARAPCGSHVQCKHQEPMSQRRDCICKHVLAVARWYPLQTSDRLQCELAPLMCRCAPAPCARFSMATLPPIVLPWPLHREVPSEPWFCAARWATWHQWAGLGLQRGCC